MRYRGRQSYDYGGGTLISDKQAADLGLTLERKPRAMGGGQGRFTDTIHVLKDGQHIGTLVTNNNGLGHSDRYTLLPTDQLHVGERHGSTHGHDLTWLLHRHATRTGAPVDFSHTSQVLSAHGAEVDRYAPRGTTRHVLKRRQDRHELIVHTSSDGKGWGTSERRPTFQKGVRAPLYSHADGIEPNSLHRAIAAWRNGKPVQESRADALIGAKLREGVR